MYKDMELEIMFDEELGRLNDKKRTGFFFNARNERMKNLAIEKGCDCMGAGMIWVDWYFTRKQKASIPCIRVKWMYPTLASRKVYDRHGRYSYKQTWDCTEKQVLFPFTLESLKAADNLVDEMLGD